MGKTCMITGGAGNLACQLSRRLAGQFDHLVLVDLAERPVAAIPPSAVYERGDVLDVATIQALLRRYRPQCIVHLASLLSGSCEQDRRRGWQVNCDGTLGLIELCLAEQVGTLLFPSSLAAYGGGLDDPVPEDAPQWPDGIYGVTKLACERLGVYYQRRHGLDFRCLRLPIVVSPFAPAGAASAFASRAFVDSVASGGFTFRVRPGTRASLVYIEDALDALVRLLTAPAERLTRRIYNIQALSPSAQEIADCIAVRLPQARLAFDPDPAVADLIESWPRRLIDESARRDWGWQPRYDLAGLADHFLKSLQSKGSAT